MRAGLLSIAVVVGVTACRDRAHDEAVPSAGPITDGVATSGPPAREFPADRRCGEAGSTPTELPPALATGRTVSRNACPEYAAIERKDLPLSFWVSTEGMRSQTFDVQGAGIGVAAAEVRAVARLEVSTWGWKHWFEPVAGKPLRVHARSWIVSIDEIVVEPRVTSPGSRLHARVLIERAPPQPSEPRVAALGCGGPSRVATELPPLLAHAPPVVDDLHLEVGGTATLGGIEVALTREPDDESMHLEIGGAEPSSLTFGAPSQFARAGAALFRVDASGEEEVHVRRLKLACPRTFEIAALDEPVTFWLGTTGYAHATVGPSTAPVVTLFIVEDVDHPQLSATTANANLTEWLAPNSIGTAFTLDGLRLEIVDVRAIGDARYDGAWITTNSVPGVAVQVRLARE